MKILDRLPYSSQTPPPLTVRGQAVPAKAHQVIVWVSVSVAGLLEWDPRTPAFPAILDTGNTFTLSIFASQLIQWAGIRPDLLGVLGRIKQGGNYYPRYEADVWLHPNIPGSGQPQSNRQPFRLSLEKGIAVYPDTTSPAPHLPLLGLQALTENDLHLMIDGQRRWAWLRTLDWRTSLLRWLL
jgi:hypothetical protein